MSRTKTAKLASVLAFLFVPLLQAQVGLNKVAQSTMNFQQVGLSARASALGEAFCAVGRGSESIFYNPAGVVESEKPFDLKLYITEWIADINYMAGALSYNMGKYGSVGLSFVNVDYGDIYTTALLDPSETALYPGGYKDTGRAGNVGAYSLGLTYGRAISTQFLIAGNMRWVGQNLGVSAMGGSRNKDNNANKLVFDAGVKYYTGLKSFRFGMTIRNFSSNIKREEIDEQLPLTFTMGAAMDLLDVVAPSHSTGNTMTLSLDFIHPNNFSERMNAGIEYTFMGMIALRAGYQSNHDIASWSAGLGLNTTIGSQLMRFDYSYSQFDVFDGVNRFSLGIAF